jgi:DNA-binding MarR family transcriptional regulator
MGHGVSGGMVGRNRSARHDAGVETTPGPSPSRAESIAALQSVLSALAYSLTRPRLHARTAAAAGVPIDRPGLALLRVLAEEAEPLRVGELAERLDVRHPHVTRQVSQLAEQGLVERVEGDEDRRVQLVAPTRRGLDTVVRVTRAAEAKLTENLGEVDPEWIMAAVDVLRRLDVRPAWGGTTEDAATPRGPGGAKVESGVLPEPDAERAEGPEAGR